MQPMGPNEVKAQTPQSKLSETLGVSAAVLAPQTDMLSLTFSLSTLVALSFIPQK